MSKAIITKFIPTTNTKPSRIKASAEGVKSIIYSKDLLENQLLAFKPVVDRDDLHRHAALQFRDANGWTTEKGQIHNLASGQLPNGDWVHCFIPQI